MTKYAIFLGCTIPARQPSYELSARKALEKLGVELVDLDNMTCCAPPPIESVATETSIAIAAYNISLAEEADLDVITLCSGCFQSLAKANKLLKKEAHIREKVNEVLSKAGKEFKGNHEVKHYLQVLKEDVGIEKIKKEISKPFNELKVASFYGCHLLRPSSLLQLDDAEAPRILDDLVEATGAESIEYMDKLKCCGGLLRGYSDDLALHLGRDKIINASKAGSDCVVTVCPFCFVALDIGQLQIRSKFKETYDLPILHYTELLSLALGIAPEELALRTHKVKVEPLLAKMGL